MPIVYVDYRSEMLQRLKDTFGPWTDEEFMLDVEAWFHIDRGDFSTFLPVEICYDWVH